MKKHRCLRLLLCSVTFLFLARANAFVSPLGVSIIPPVQFPGEEFTITGARLSLLWGHHRDVYGLDFGVLGNVSEVSFTGLALSGVFNLTHGTTHVIGLQAAGVANVNTQKTSVYGVQLALGVNANTAESTITGVQFAAVNLSDHTDIRGLQVGIYNTALNVYGLQIGLVNVAASLHGIQIGLVNFNHTGPFVVSPILNVGF
jgi:hypothetical protein